MKNQKQCKIVQDLLPTYIEDLTSEETNQYIEEHIKNCNDCKLVLLDMQGELKLEKINKNMEINGLKKVKRRMILEIFFSVVIVILIFAIGLYINNNYTLYINEKGDIAIKSYKTELTISNSKYLIMSGKEKREGTEDGYAYVSIIATINDKQVCTNMRYIESGYTEEKLQELYNTYVDNAQIGGFTNIEIIKNKLCYNSNFKNGKNKEFIIEDFKEYYDIVEKIEEW